MSLDGTLQVAAHLRLPASPTAPSRARKFLAATLSGLDVEEDLAYTISLLTSELVTNAVVHGRSDVDLRLEWPGGLLRVGVTDENPRRPVVHLDQDLTALSGRGLALVDALATDWGIDDTSDGKEIWFSLEVPELHV